MSKSPSLRRIKADIRELSHDPSDRYHAAPLEDDMFEWHFTIRGADETEFEGGIYHGRILLPAEYPFKPPHIVFLTPSGRFETGTKVCLSFSAYHPELWQPAWGIRLILEALISFLPTPADGAIGSLDWSKEERKRLAKKSIGFCCPRCGNVAEFLPKLEGKPKALPRFQKEIEQLRALQIANETKNKAGTGGGDSVSVGGGNGNGSGNVSEGTKEDRVDGKERADDGRKEDGGSTDEVATPQLVNDGDKAEDARKETESKEVAEGKTDDGDDAALSNGAISRRRDGPPDGVSEGGDSNAVRNERNAEGRRDAEAAEAAAAAVVPPDAEVGRPASMPPWFADSIVHAAIVIFAVVVYMLYQKTLVLVMELNSL